MPETDDGFVAETWLYAGRRLSSKEVLTAWSPPEGPLVYFGPKGASRLAVGHPYAVTISRANGGMTKRGEPTFLTLDAADRTATDDEKRAWRAEDAAVSQTLETEKLEKAAKKDDELDAALEVLRAYNDKLTYQRRSAFGEWVRAEILRPPKSR